MGKLPSKLELANVWLLFVCLTNKESYMYMAVILIKVCHGNLRLNPGCIQSSK